jgi:hypothetical protein
LKLWGTVDLGEGAVGARDKSEFERGFREIFYRDMIPMMMVEQYEEMDSVLEEYEEQEMRWWMDSVWFCFDAGWC